MNTNFENKIYIFVSSTDDQIILTNKLTIMAKSVKGYTDRKKLADFICR